LGVGRYEDADRAALAAAKATEQDRTREALGDVGPAFGHLYRDVLLGSVSHELAALVGMGLPLPRGYHHASVWPFDPGSTSTEPPSLLTQADLGDDRILDLSWLWLPDYPDYDERITILGQAGAISLRLPQPYGPSVAASLHVVRPDGRDARSSEVRGEWDSGFLHELRAFHASVTSGAPVRVDADMARAITASIQALTVAIAAERGVSVGGEAAVSAAGP
jgi:predicted dehydrogenase